MQRIEALSKDSRVAFNTITTHYLSITNKMLTIKLRMDKEMINEILVLSAYICKHKKKCETSTDFKIPYLI